MKSVFDKTIALIVIVFFSPLFILISILIKILSPGPIIFKHKRIGMGGEKFFCYKFRTMVIGSEDILEEYLKNDTDLKKEWEENFKLKNDPRLTRLGVFLRTSSLDELPQLFNVIKGDMSLVGPRPIVQKEIEKYGNEILDYYSVLPGITGVWQVNGRSDTSYRERVIMDSWYVKNRSLILDIKLLIKTVKKVLIKEGAY